MRLHSSLPRPSEIRLPAKVRQIDTGCGTALSHPVEAVNDRLQKETQPEGPPPDNRAQVNGLGFQSLGSIASDRDVRGARAMSAMPGLFSWSHGRWREMTWARARALAAFDGIVGATWGRRTNRYGSLKQKFCVRRLGRDRLHHSTKDIAQVTALGATASRIATVSTRPNKQNRSARSSMPLSIPLAPCPSCEPVHSRPKKSPAKAGAGSSMGVTGDD